MKNKNFIKSLSYIALGALFTFSGLDTANATPVTGLYSLDGTFQNGIDLVRTHSTVASGFDTAVNFEGVTINITENAITFGGTATLCVGAAGSNCFGNGEFLRENAQDRGLSLITGSGQFDVSGTIDLRTNENGEFFADMQDGLNFSLVEDQRNEGVDPNINLAIKAHPDLGYAIRGFETAGNPSVLQLFSWLQFTSDTKAIGGILGGASRGESLFGESVFNFDNGGLTATEVPEPMTVTLLGMGLLGGALRRKKNAA